MYTVDGLAAAGLAGEEAAEQRLEGQQEQGPGEAEHMDSTAQRVAEHMDSMAVDVDSLAHVTRLHMGWREAADGETEAGTNAELQRRGVVGNEAVGVGSWCHPRCPQHEEHQPLAVGRFRCMDEQNRMIGDEARPEQPRY